MYFSKIFKVTGLHFSYLLRRVQDHFLRKQEHPEELLSALQECQTIEQLLDFFFTTDFYVDEGFIRLFEKRMQEIECPF